MSTAAAMPISVVVPTLGGPSLESTFAALHAGTVVPDEILVCLPEAEAANVRTFPWPNVRVVVTNVRGQVGQRAIGFAQARNPLVLQLDDDLVVAPDALELLRESLLSFPPRTAVSPALMDRATGASVYRTAARGGVSGWVNRWLTNGGREPVPGKIMVTGGALGIDALASDQRYHDVEWLPGGCILHHRENLVLENFYPFRGKAFCEDIIHSHHLRHRGIALKIDTRARVSVDVPTEVLSFGAFRKEVRADLAARRHFMTLSSRSPFLTYAFATSRCLGYLVERLRGRA